MKGNLHRKAVWASIAALAMLALVIVGGYLMRRRSNSPEQLLLNVEHDLNDIYRTYHPFPYRWSGVPYALHAGQPQRVPEKLLRRQVSAIDRSELVLGRTAFSLRLLGRINLLAGNYEQAVETYRLGTLRFPADTNLRAELAVSFAMRAESEHRALDYERALESILAIEPPAPTPENLFNTALLFEQVPLPGQAIERWEKAIGFEPFLAWREEEERRLDKLKHFLQARQERIQNLTSSPASYLAHAGGANGSLELVVETAIAEWLPLIKSSAIHAKALANLANALDVQYHDPWLSDLLAKRDNTGAGMRSLSESWNANAEGDYIRAEHLAASAESFFHQSGNPAGVLRSRVERVYALDRQLRPKECINALNNLRLEAHNRHYTLNKLRSEAHNRHYTWIEGQSWLEEITCRTETRRSEVITVRSQAYDWISKTRYEVLRLRALSFLTEDYVSFGSRLSIWERGRSGLESFWRQEASPGRGYTFYYTMGDSARAAGDERAALVLLREGVRLLESSPHRQLLGLTLARLAMWQSEAGLYSEADKTFNEMEAAFSQLKERQKQVIWQEAEIQRADSEVVARRSPQALSRLEQLTSGIIFPFSLFSPMERRQLLAAFGNGYLAEDQLSKARRCYDLIIREASRDLRAVRNPSQRDNAQREIAAAWRGSTEICLRQHQSFLGWKNWEEHRSGRWNKGDWSFSQLPENTAFVAYAFLYHGLSAWVIQRSGIHQEWLNGERIKIQVERFSSLVSDPDSPLLDVQALGKDLYETLIGPLQPYLDADRLLIIEPDGPLAALPWSALTDEHGHFLVERYAVTQATGWLQVAARIRSGNLDSDRPLILTDPALGAELRKQYGPLLDALREGHYLQGLLPASTFVAGPDATFDAFTTLAPKSTMLHFGGHGISYGGFGALLLAAAKGEDIPGRLVTATEIEKLKLEKLQLVVLAACSSGAGEQLGTVNLESLVQAFLRAGASRVVAARWNVSSSQSADLVERFYDVLLHRQYPAEALRQAALFILRNSSTRHPYYWAAFQLFGSP